VNWFRRWWLESRLRGAGYGELVNNWLVLPISRLLRGSLLSHFACSIDFIDCVIFCRRPVIERCRRSCNSGGAQGRVWDTELVSAGQILSVSARWPEAGYIRLYMNETIRIWRLSSRQEMDNREECWGEIDSASIPSLHAPLPRCCAVRTCDSSLGRDERGASVLHDDCYAPP
jgi:hypothetical protein